MQPTAKRQAPGAFPFSELARCAVAFACAFLFVETHIAARSPYAFTILGQGSGQVVLGFGTYALAVFILSCIVWRALYLVPRWYPSQNTAVPAAATLGALGTWGALAGQASQVCFQQTLAVYVLLLVTGGIVLLVTRRDWASLRTTAAALCLAFLSGTATLYLANRYAFMNVGRRAIELELSLLALGVVLAAGGMNVLQLRRRMLGKRYATVRLMAATAVVPVALMLLAMPRGHRDEERPSILLVSADTLRADYCSVYGGHVATPALEALAKRGVLFERCYSLAPWTLPSLNALFASKYPPGLAPDAAAGSKEDMASYVTLARYWLDENGKSFPARLGEHGYSTGALVGNDLMDQPWLMDGFQQRTVFDLIDDMSQPPNISRLPVLGHALGGHLPWFAPSRFPDQTECITRYTIEFLRRHGNAPFFLWVHYLDPHAPYAPPGEFLDDTDVRAATDLFGPERLKLFRVGFGEDLLDENTKAGMRALYEGEIRYVDHALSRIEAELAALGLGRSAYFFFTSDHGEEMWDHGELGHGQSLHDELTRVPLICVGPEIAPQRIASPVSAIDLVPTLADLAGLSASGSWRGQSWVDALKHRDEPGLERPCFSQATMLVKEGSQIDQSVVVGNHKLIRSLQTGTLELYDLSTDPKEQAGTGDIDSETREELSDLLDQWSGSFPSTFAEFDSQDRQEAPEEVLERLRALGYVE